MLFAESVGGGYNETSVYQQLTEWGGAKLPAYGAHIKGDSRVFRCAL